MFMMISFPRLLSPSPFPVRPNALRELTLFLSLSIPVHPPHQLSALLQFEAVGPIQSVYQYLKEKRALGVLRHPDLATATMEILPDGRSARHSPPSPA